MNRTLIVDKVFKTLIPPLTKEEFDQLEANCLENGIQDSLKTWNGILVDGHNRYEIAQKHGLEFRTEEMEFTSRDDVKLWIIKNQLGRRNLSTYDRGVLALKLKPVIAAMAEQNLHLSEGKGCQKSDKVKPIVTNKEVAKAGGVSHDTIHKVDVIENSDNEEVKKAVHNKEMSIDKAYREVKGLPPKKKSQPQTEVRNVEVMVVREQVGEERIVEVPVVDVSLPPKEVTVTFIDADESHENTSDPDNDGTETSDLDYAEKVLVKLLMINYTVDNEGIDRICNLDCESFDREMFKDRLSKCIKILTRLEIRLKLC